MAFSFTEVPDSRAQESGTADNASHTLRYKAVGEQDDFTVHAYAIDNTPLFVARPTGILYRSRIALDPDGFQQYFVTVTYGKPSASALPTGSYTFNFDTTGGTTHVTTARKHISTTSGFGDAVTNHKGNINVQPDGQVQGADIIVPALKFSLAFKLPQGVVSVQYVKRLASITGCTNRLQFLDYAPGELLFMGATGSDGSQTEMEVTYQFEASENATGLTYGDIAAFDKKGHELLWIEHMDSVDEHGNGVTIPHFAHVEQVYPDADFSSVFQWNIFTG